MSRYWTVMQPIHIQRRKMLLSAGASALALEWGPVLAQTSESVPPNDPLSTTPQDAALIVNRRKAEQIVANVLRGRSLREGLIEATVPDIAEDGSMVPVSFLVNCSMKNDDYPKTVHVIGMVNPTPEVARYHFTPACGEAAVVFRCRMHASSYLSFIANMADGTVGMTQRFVSVTASGCI